MRSLLLAVIYLIFVSLGLPDPRLSHEMDRDRLDLPDRGRTDRLFIRRPRHGADLSVYPAHGAREVRPAIQCRRDRSADGFRLRRQYLYAHDLRTDPAKDRHLDHAVLSAAVRCLEYRHAGVLLQKEPAERQAAVWFFSVNRIY